MKETRIIKRYRNRKLYDTDRSCYITLAEIGEMIQQGQELVVCDNQTQKDLTSWTFIQVLLEMQKKSDDQIPVSTLRHVIKQKKDFFQVLAEMTGNGVQKEIIRVLENQVQILSEKLKSLEQSATIAMGKEAKTVVLDI